MTLLTSFFGAPPSEDALLDWNLQMDSQDDDDNDVPMQRRPPDPRKD